jgi:hypothetical protein
VERQFWQHLSCQQKNIFLTKYLDGQSIRTLGLKAFRSYQLFKLRFLETTKSSLKGKLVSYQVMMKRWDKLALYKWKVQKHHILDTK